MTDTEIFKDIVGYEGIYKISNLGKIYSVKNNMYKKLHTNRVSNYVICGLDNMGAKQFTLHRLLAQHFIDNPENKPCVDHINRDRTDNRLENLRWVTFSENNLNRENKGSIWINKRTVNNKTYEYYRVKIGSKNIGSFKTRADAETALNLYTSQTI